MQRTDHASSSREAVQLVYDDRVGFAAGRTLEEGTHAGPIEVLTALAFVGDQIDEG